MTFEHRLGYLDLPVQGGQGQVIPAGVRDLINAPIVLPSHFLEKSIFAFKVSSGPGTYKPLSAQWSLGNQEVNWEGTVLTNSNSSKAPPLCFSC